MAERRVEFELYPDDLLTAVGLAAVSDPTLPRRFLRARLAACFVALVGLTAAAFAHLTFDEVVGPGYLALAFLLLAVRTWPTRTKWKRAVVAHVRSQLPDPAVRRVFGRRSYVLLRDGFAYESDRGRGEVFWPAVVRTHLDADYLILTAPGPLLHIIPRTGFDTDEAFEAFADDALGLVAAHRRDDPEP